MKRKLRELWEMWPVIAFALVVILMAGPYSIGLRGCAALVGMK